MARNCPVSNCGESCISEESYRLHLLYHVVITIRANLEEINQTLKKLA